MAEPGEGAKIQAERLDAGSYEQAHPRYLLRLKISLQILIPEETFSTSSMDASLIDVSAEGMQVRVPKMSFKLYNRMLQRTRLGRITLVRPHTKETIKLTGRIMWMDYHRSAPHQDSASCKLGIFFNPEDGVDAKYRRFIDSIVPG